jgi:hypothetical protein
MLLWAIEKGTNVGSIGSENSKALGLRLGCEMFRGNNGSELLTRIVNGLEQSEYKEPWWLEKE